MADIPDRTERETRLANRLDAIAAPVRGALRAGRSVDWGATQAAMTQAMQDELIATYIVMFLLFWEDSRWQTLLTNAQKPSQDALALGSLGLIAPRVEATIGGMISDAQKRQQQHGGKIPRGEPTGLERPRIERTTVTETTSAGTAGEEAARREAQRAGLIVETYWVTENDARVCPLCSPLHETREDVWRRVIPDGPPAHPNCRCYLRREMR